MVHYGNCSRRSYSRSCYRYGGSLMSIYRPGVYGNYTTAVDQFIPAEVQHFATASTVNLAARNPYVFLGALIVHAGYHGYHLLSKYLDSGSSSETYQQNGGPETKSTYKPSGRSRSVSSAHGGRRSAAKPRKRCPTGFRWNGRRCVKR